MKSVYIHIPFCNSICTYCDFSKFLSNTEWKNNYLKELEKEIKTNYKGEVINTIYIGGGTPSSLSIEELKKLFDILKMFKMSKNVEFTFECNIEDINENLLEILKANKVNRLSIGIQTFNNKLLKYLNRHHTKKTAIKNIKLAKKYFNNINIDLIYAIPGETLKDLKKDLNTFLKLKLPHISTYSLIIEPNTKLYIDNEDNIEEDLDYKMYNLILKTLKKYNHYEISNFSLDNYESKHNLTYWNNNEYYGFGIGASGYINGIRYDNTRSYNEYIKGNYILDKHKVLKKEKLENEFILGFRKLNGINKKEFKDKYNMNIKDIKVVKKLLKENKLQEDKKNIYINKNYIYVSNDILIEFIN